MGHISKAVQRFKPLSRHHYRQDGNNSVKRGRSSLGIAQSALFRHKPAQQTARHVIKTIFINQEWRDVQPVYQV
jgi:hypothetical protein